MNRMNFDWRWVSAIAVIVLLTQATRLPWYLMAAILAGGGAYFISLGWNAWRRENGGGSSRVTYWRGQRYEVAPQRGPALPRWRDVAPALVFLAIGSVLVLAAASLVLQVFGVSV